MDKFSLDYGLPLPYLKGENISFIHYELILHRLKILDLTLSENQILMDEISREEHIPLTH